MNQMDQETADYIVTYFFHLLNDKEKLANRHLSSLIKIGSSDGSNDVQKLTNVYRKAGWLTEDQDALALVELGWEGFRLKVAARILSQHRDKVFLNYCDKCRKLARTPAAKQCRRCGYDWH